MNTPWITLLALCIAAEAAAAPMTLDEKALAGVAAGAEASVAQRVVTHTTVTTTTDVNGVVTTKSQTVTQQGPGTVGLVTTVPLAVLAPDATMTTSAITQVTTTTAVIAGP